MCNTSFNASFTNSNLNPGKRNPQLIFSLVTGQLHTQTRKLVSSWTSQLTDLQQTVTCFCGYFENRDVLFLNVSFANSAGKSRFFKNVKS